MSHDATNWAIKQRGLKPATKIVLWHLADCHNGHTGQCNPKQETLAYLCEMSRSTVNLHLDKLEEMGLIRREQHVDKATRKKRPTHYVLSMDEPEKTVSESRTRALDMGPDTQDMVQPVSENETRAVSEKQPKPCPKNGDSRVRNSDIKNPGREPGKEPGARDRAAKAISVLNEVLSQQVAQDFADHRRAIRKPLTVQAARLISKSLASCRDPDAVANRSIMNGWQGVFPESSGTAGASPGGAPADATVARWEKIAKRNGATG